MGHPCHMCGEQFTERQSLITHIEEHKRNGLLMYFNLMEGKRGNSAAPQQVRECWWRSIVGPVCSLFIENVPHPLFVALPSYLHHSAFLSLLSLNVQHHFLTTLHTIYFHHQDHPDMTFAVDRALKTNYLSVIIKISFLLRMFCITVSPLCTHISSSSIFLFTQNVPHPLFIALHSYVHHQDLFALHLLHL